MSYFPPEPRRLTVLLIALSLLAAGTVFGYAPDPRINYWFYSWVPSEVTKPHEVIGSEPKTCHDYSEGSVCAEFTSWVSGDVAGMCCLDPADLGSTDPRRCLTGATYSRDTAPVE